MAGEAGQGCASRTAFQGVTGRTYGSEGAPASIGGSCNLVSWWARSNGSLDWAACFFTASGNNLTTVTGTRIFGSHDFGTTAACHAFEAPGDFTAFSVSAGHYVGVYVQAGTAGYGISYGLTGGAGLWYITGDYTNASSQAFTFDADGIDSISANITAGGGLSIPVAMADYRRLRG